MQLDLSRNGVQNSREAVRTIQTLGTNSRVTEYTSHNRDRH